jgi:hypothetical protein
MDKSTSTPTENSDGGRLQMSKHPSDQGDHFQQRARFAHDIARRLADGANLDSLAHWNNMTVDQVVRMVAMFAVQASDVGKVCLGTVCLSSLAVLLICSFCRLFPGSFWSGVECISILPDYG